MPSILAKNRKEAIKNLKDRFGNKVAVSTTRKMKRPSKFQRTQYGQTKNWYRADYKKPKILKRIEMSIRFKEKNGWKRSVGAGFIKDDIFNITVHKNGKITLQLWDKNPKFAHKQTFELKDFNLRETEEVRDYLSESHLDYL